MFKIILVVLFFVGLIAWEAPQLIRKKEIKELIVFSFLLLIGLGLSIIAVVRSFL